MPGQRLIVLKFGSSVLATERDLPRAVAEIDRWRRAGWGVVAVVSALRGGTDRLLADAGRLAERPNPASLASLVATGEQYAAAALALALDRAGLASRELDAASLGLRTVGDPLDGVVVGARLGAVRQALRWDEVVVAPGFVARDGAGRTSLLGRGGSDYTAVCLALALGARCRLVKDVRGVYAGAPGLFGARRYATLPWDEALALGAKVVQPKALRYAAAHGLEIEVARPDADEATRIGRGPAAFADDDDAPPPVRVALLGAGTVGLGVLRHLLDRSERFEVVGVAVRDASRAVARGAPSRLVTTDIDEPLRRAPDLAIEACGGLEPGARWMEAALLAGVDVATVNKTAVSRAFERLAGAAAAGGANWRFSGAVGGAAPILAAARRLREDQGVDSFEAVLNGTSNFVLERMSAGASFDEAVREAQALGFAEADPAADLDGVDAAEKLAIVAREAFGGALHPDEVRRIGLRASDGARCVREAAEGRRVRLVASLRRKGGGLIAEVAPREVSAHGWLGLAREEWNAATFRLHDGSAVRVRGRGAGRWPTAQAALADALELSRARAGAGVAP